MKRNGSYLRQYLPWLGLLLGVDALAALLLWLADARAFAAMTAVIVLATVFLFAGVCSVLCARSKRREQAFTAFLTTPDAAHEQALCRLLSPAESRSAHLLGETLRAQQQTIAQLQAQMDDYENYVELWTHEVKTPLALLTLVLDNRRDTLPEAVGFKLDYVRNRMQAFIDQMLYYARLRGARRDYRFDRLALRSCIDEVLDDYRPLLEEKHFRVELRLADETVFSDRRGLCFLLGQVVSNSVKYALDALLNAAYFAGADMVLFGHTHHAMSETIQGLYVVNPGTAGVGPACTYACIETKDSAVRTVGIHAIPET